MYNYFDEYQNNYTDFDVVVTRENPQPQADLLLSMFKALADANRLKIIGLLAQRDYSVEHLAELLGLQASTVSHHLARLADVGLVSARAESYYNMYMLRHEALEEMAHSLLSKDVLPAIASQIDLDAYDRKVVANYLLPSGQMKTIPAQRKKLEVILRYIVQDFQAGERYSEQEVNKILSKYHEDVATLRRELVGYHLLARKSGIYWRVEDDERE
jgi:predicted transcriptional regulator